MTTQEYEETIRPALGKFCGYEYSDKYSLWHDPQGVSCYPSDLPDPLHNPADAWALYVALLRHEPYRGILWYSGDHAEFHSSLSQNPENSQTAEQALVAYAWEVVRQTAERPSGE